jgi:hypothetical protein
MILSKKIRYHFALRRNLQKQIAIGETQVRDVQLAQALKKSILLHFLLLSKELTLSAFQNLACAK